MRTGLTEHEARGQARDFIDALSPEDITEKLGTVRSVSFLDVYNGWLHALQEYVVPMLSWLGCPPGRWDLEAVVHSEDSLTKNTVDGDPLRDCATELIKTVHS